MKLKFKNIVLILISMVLCSASFLVSSISFSSVCEDKNYISLHAIQDDDKHVNGTKFAFKFTDFGSFVKDDWNKYSESFDARYTTSAYATIFRARKDTSISVNDDFACSVSDITYYKDPNFNMGSIRLLVSDGTDFSKLKEHNSVYIDTAIADFVKQQYGINDQGYHCVLNKTINLPIFNDQEFFIKGVYNEKSAIGYRDLNSLYNETLGHTVFVSRDTLNEITEKTSGYIFIGDNLKTNLSIFDYLKARFIWNPSFSDVSSNNGIIVRGYALPAFYSLPNIPSAIPLFAIASLFILLICLIVFAFFSLAKLALLFFKFFKKTTISFFVFFFALSGLFISISFVVNKTNIFDKFGFYVLKNQLSNIMIFVLIILFSLFFLSCVIKTSNYFHLSAYFSKPSNLHFKDFHYNTIRLDNKKKDDYGKTKTIVLFSNSISPNSAGGQRAICDAKILSSLGFNVIISGNSDIENPVEYDNIKVSLWEPYQGHNKIFKRFWFLNKKRVKNALSNIEQIDYLFIYSVLSISQATYIKKISRKRKIPLIFDVVEFQNLKEQSIRTFFTYYLSNVFMNRFIIDKNCYVLSISDYLNSYFNNRRINSIKLPFINSETSNCLEHKFDEKNNTVFLYAGSPGKKDYLYGMIMAFDRIDISIKENCMFIVAGPSVSDLNKLGIPASILKRNINYLHFIGTVPYSKMKQLYAISDFTVLFKNNKQRHAKADFPSKVSQSLANGVPVISNSSSDLSHFLIDGYNSLFFDDFSISELTNQLIKAALLDKKIVKQMSENSIQTVTESLSFETGVKAFLDLFSKMS